MATLLNMKAYKHTHDHYLLVLKRSETVSHTANNIFQQCIIIYLFIINYNPKTFYEGKITLFFWNQNDLVLICLN